MNANWKRSREKAQLPRVTMEKFVRRQMIDEHVSKLSQQHEDTALHADLRRIGVDLKAWGEEEIRIDETTGEVSFHAKSCDDIH